MEILGFSQEEILNILKVVSCILKLGNLIFIPTNNIDGTEGCMLNNEYGKCIFQFLLSTVFFFY